MSWNQNWLKNLLNSPLFDIIIRHDYISLFEFKKLFYVSISSPWDLICLFPNPTKKHKNQINKGIMMKLYLQFFSIIYQLV